MASPLASSLEEVCGSALVIANGVWIASHYHQHPNRASDIFMILGTIGAVLVLYGLYRRIARA
jgi:hypothetical protein